MLRRMSQRTQIYLTADQRARIDTRMRREGASLASVVREALEQYLADEVVDTDAALDATFGVAPDLAVPSREEWDRE